MTHSAKHSNSAHVLVTEPDWDDELVSRLSTKNNAVRDCRDALSLWQANTFLLQPRAYCWGTHRYSVD
jgi:hypothetical protein